MATRNNKAVLKGQVTRLQRILADEAKALAAVATERDEALREADHKAKLAHDRWEQIGALKEQLQSINDNIEAAHCNARLAEQEKHRLQRALDRKNGELDAVRGYIEGLLDGLHPARPTLPWERERVEMTTEQHINLMENLR